MSMKRYDYLVVFFLFAFTIFFSPSDLIAGCGDPPPASPIAPPEPYIDLPNDCVTCVNNTLVPADYEDPGQECKKCSGGVIVRDAKTIKIDDKGLADCRKAVEEEIGKQYIALEKIYNDTVKIINKEAAKLSKECEKKFDKNGMFYQALVYSCKALVSSSQGANLAAAYTTYETGRVALGLALQAGYLECSSLFPCAGR